MRRPPRRGWRAFARDTAGSGAVEFALIATPLFLLLFGGIETARGFWTRQAMQSIANSGARCMGVGNSACANAGVYSVALTRSHLLAMAHGSIVPLTASNLTLDHNATCSGVSGFSKVSIRYTFQTAVPALIKPFADGVVLSVAACFPNQT